MAPATAAQSQQKGSRAMELRDYLRIVSTRRWIIIQAIAVVAIVAFVGSLMQTPIYEAETSILVRERGGSPNIFGDVLPVNFIFQPERLLQTQVELMKLRPLAEDVIRRLNLKTTPASVLSQLKIEPVGQTNIVKVKITDPDARRATTMANAFAEAYVNWSRDSNQAATKKARETVADKLDEAQGELFKVAKEITARQSGGRLVPEELKAQLQVGTGLFVTLSEKLEALTINEALEQGLGQVVSPAVLPKAPVRPRPTLNLFLGLIVGSVLGLGGALLAEYLDNTIKSADDAERYYEAPALAMVPAHGQRDEKAHQVVVLGDPHTPEAEAYRALRTSLDYLNFDGALKRILITSAAPQEGKSTTLVNVAASMAQAGRRVLVIGCDFRRPALHRFFGLQNKVGLSDVLTGRVSLRAAIQDSGVPNLGILLSGPMPPNPSELLGSATMRSLLDQAQSLAEIVLLDSPPVLAVTDCAVLAPLVDGIVMVCEAGESTREAAQASVRVLQPSDTRVLGVVLNNADPMERRGYYYHYYYEYYRPRGGGDPQGGDQAAARPADEFLRSTAAVPAEAQVAGVSGRQGSQGGRHRNRPHGVRVMAPLLFNGLSIAAGVAVLVLLVALVDAILGLGVLASAGRLIGGGG